MTTTNDSHPFRQEWVAFHEGQPLRLDFSPAAIREHFDPENVSDLTPDQLRKVGAIALEDEGLYEAFHHALSAALDHVRTTLTRPERTNRRVHAQSDEMGMEVVRYDRAGKWYLEPSRHNLPRQRVTIDGAVDYAVRFCVIHLGLPGGTTFDRKVNQRRENP